MFYSFRQNNSGGSFRIDPDAGISVNVIIEADSATEANERANEIGIYFQGVYWEQDCECCGDRWDPVDSYDASSVPSIYGRPIKDEGASISTRWAGDSPEGFIHYADGSQEAIWARKDIPGTGWKRQEIEVTSWPLVEAQVIEAIAA